MTDAYATFLDRKSQIGGMSGFDPLWMPDFLFPFQQSLVEWSVRKGRAAISNDRPRAGERETHMPKVSDLSVSRYVSKKDLDHPRTFTVLRYALETVESDEGKEEKYVLYFNEFDKGLILKPVIGGQLEEIFGSDDFDNWIGKSVELWIDPAVRFGQNKGGIRARRPQGMPERHQTAPARSGAGTAPIMPASARDALREAWTGFKAACNGDPPELVEQAWKSLIAAWFPGKAKEDISVDNWRALIGAKFKMPASAKDLPEHDPALEEPPF